MNLPLNLLDGVAAALPVADVDTDCILPARFMTTITRTGLGRALFHGLRYDAQGAERPDFVLNRQPWRAAVFLIVLDNFGCGSSREHAPWALLDFGIRCVIAPSFADIFSSNCVKNGILPLTLDRVACERLIAATADPAGVWLHLDLDRQTLRTAPGQVIDFAIAAERKRRLLAGVDDIAETMHHGRDIAAHEAQVRYARPCVPVDIDIAAQTFHDLPKRLIG